MQSSRQLLHMNILPKVLVGMSSILFNGIHQFCIILWDAFDQDLRASGLASCCLISPVSLSISLLSCLAFAWKLGRIIFVGYHMPKLGIRYWLDMVRYSMTCKYFM